MVEVVLIFEYQVPERTLEELVHDEGFMDVLGGPLDREVGEDGGVSDGDKCSLVVECLALGRV